MTKRVVALLALVLSCACNDRPAAVPAYEPVRLEPFTIARATLACPKGYDVLWRKECVDNPDYNAAMVLCRPAEPAAE
jgi:hypothetical protein